MKLTSHKSESNSFTENKKADSYKLCPNCANFSHKNENHIYCSICGTKLIEECPICKIKIENPTAKYCVKCGSKLLLKEGILGIDDGKKGK